MYKYCSQCDTDKDINEFYTRNNKPISLCKVCTRLNVAEYKQSNPDKIKFSKKKHRENNKEYYSNYGKEYRKSNREKLNRKNNEYKKKRRKEDIGYRLKGSISARIRKSVERKSNSSMELLGCDINFYKEYLKELFTEGMSWDNYGEWQIDHKIPVSSFNLNDKTEVFRCFNYKNTQPLWAADNLRKSNRVENI